MNKYLVFGLIGLFALIFIFGIFKPASMVGTGCNLGMWYFSSYDSSSNTIKISGNFGEVGNGGTLCYGNSLDNPVQINDKVTCNAFFYDGAWNDEFSKCYPTSASWFDNKEVKGTFGNCYYNNEGRSLTTQNYFPSFDGSQVSVGWSKPQLRDTISCNGGFVVGYKATSQSQITGQVTQQNTTSQSQQQSQPIPQGQVSQNQIPQPKSFLQRLWEWFINLFRA